MHVAQLCVSGGWVGSLYNHQYSQPALSTSRSSISHHYLSTHTGGLGPSYEQSARSWLLRSRSSTDSPTPPSSPEQSARSWSPLRSFLLLLAPLGCTLLREWLPSPPGGLPSNACLGVHGVLRRRRGERREGRCLDSRALEGLEI